MNDILQALVARRPELEVCLPNVEAAFDTLRSTFRQGGKLLICGNGGSAADSEHIVGELMKGFNSRRPVPEELRRKIIAAFPAEGEYLAGHLQGALPALSLISQTSLLSAFANDVAPDMAIAQQVLGYAAPGDSMLAITTSGRSSNILNAVRVARVVGCRTLCLTGPQGGPAAALSDVAICVPGESTSDIQERHQAVYHALCAMLEDEFFPSQEV